MTEDRLARIAELLALKGLRVDMLQHPRSDFVHAIWSITDPVDETIIRVLISADLNDNPAFWPESFNSSSAAYVAPIVTKLGDAIEECHIESVRGRASSPT